MHRRCGGQARPAASRSSGQEGEARIKRARFDGPHHALQRSADARRDRALGRLGYRVLRVSASDVCERLDDVLDVIRAALRA